MNRLKFIIWCMVPLFLLTVAGCGGSGSGSGSPTTVSGVAASGSPISGTVSLKDSSLPAKERSAPINADGSFSFDMAGLTPPFLLKASGTANGIPTTLYSLSSAGGTANINPLSSLAVALAHGSAALDALYGSPDPFTLRDISHALAGAVRDVQTALRPTLEKFGAASVNFITGPYVANHQGLDLMLDLMSIFTMSNGIVIMGDRMSSTQCPLGQFTAGSYDFVTTPLPTVGTLYVMPAVATLSTGSTLQFKAFIVGSRSSEFSWSVVEDGGGSFMDGGLYTAPLTAGTYHVKVTSVAEPGKSGTVAVTVTEQLGRRVAIIPAGPGVYAVMAQNFVDVGGCEIEITYDTTAFANPRIVQGDLTARTMFVPNPQFRPNVVKLAFMSLMPIVGSGTLATITFDQLGTVPGTVQVSRLIFAPPTGSPVTAGGGSTVPAPAPGTAGGGSTVPSTGGSSGTASEMGG